MAKKLFIGNLSWELTNEELKATFEAIGEVEDAAIIFDRETGRSRGFGFVTFVNDEDGQKAINELNETELNGRMMYISEARENNRDD